MEDNELTVCTIIITLCNASQSSIIFFERWELQRMPVHLKNSLNLSQQDTPQRPKALCIKNDVEIKRL